MDDAILGIDTATSDVAAACTRGDEVVFERLAGSPAEGRPRHSSALLELVGDAVGTAGGWARIEAIAVGLGPGTFTGLRVGIATARALGQARGLPLVGVELARGAGPRDRGTARTPAARAHRRPSQRGLRGALRPRRRDDLATARRGPGGGRRAHCRARCHPTCRRGRLATIPSGARGRWRGGASRRGPDAPDGGAAHLRARRGRRSGGTRAGEAYLPTKTRCRSLARAARPRFCRQAARVTR